MTMHRTDDDLRREGTDPFVPLRPPTPGGISMRPAMIVVGLAALILVVFVAIAIITSQAPAPVRNGAASSAVPGSALTARAATATLSPIVRPGEPPTNIVNAVSIPSGSVRVAHQDNSVPTGQFDAQVTLRSDDSQAALLAFYAADMRLQGWQVFDRGPASNHPGALEVLGKLAGSDGYYWELGVTISATTFTPDGPPRGVTDFTVRLLQLSDSQ